MRYSSSLFLIPEFELAQGEALQASNVGAGSVGRCLTGIRMKQIATGPSRPCFGLSASDPAAHGPPSLHSRDPTATIASKGVARQSSTNRRRISFKPPRAIEFLTLDWSSLAGLVCFSSDMRPWYEAQTQLPTSREEVFQVFTPERPSASLPRDRRGAIATTWVLAYDSPKIHHRLAARGLSDGTAWRLRVVNSRRRI